MPATRNTSTFATDTTMYLLVSIDTGIVRSVPDIHPELNREVMESVSLGTLDVFRSSRGEFLQLGFDGTWCPVEMENLSDVLGSLPTPVMARLPHETPIRKGA